MVERVDPDAQDAGLLRRARGPLRPAGHRPVNMGADFVARSGLGDELNYVPVDKHTLLSTAYDEHLRVGDAVNIPASKAGSVAHFSVDLFVDNFVRARRRPADDRALRRPRELLRRVRRRQGAAHRLQLRHRAAARAATRCRASARSACSRRPAPTTWGKLAFRWMYWNVLLPGRPDPAAGPHVHGRQAPVDTDRGGRSHHARRPRSTATQSTSTTRAS